MLPIKTLDYSVFESSFYISFSLCQESWFFKDISDYRIRKSHNYSFIFIPYYTCNSLRMTTVILLKTLKSILLLILSLYSIQDWQCLLRHCLFSKMKCLLSSILEHLLFLRLPARKEEETQPCSLKAGLLGYMVSFWYRKAWPQNLGFYSSLKVLLMM